MMLVDESHLNTIGIECLQVDTHLDIRSLHQAEHQIGQQVRTEADEKVLLRGGVHASMTPFVR